MAKLNGDWVAAAENTDWVVIGVIVSAFLPFRSGFGRVVVVVELADRPLKPAKPENGVAAGFFGEFKFLKIY